MVRECLGSLMTLQVSKNHPTAFGTSTQPIIIITTVTHPVIIIRLITISVKAILKIPTLIMETTALITPIQKIRTITAAQRVKVVKSQMFKTKEGMSAKITTICQILPVWMRKAIRPTKIHLDFCTAWKKM